MSKQRLDQHGNSGESSGLSLSPIGVKEVGPAPGADAGNLDILIPYSCLHQLPAAYGPQIKVIFADHEVLKAFGEYLPVAYEFRTAGTQGRADSRQEVFRFTIKLLAHAGYYPAQDIADIPPPAAVDIGQHPFPRVEDYDALAVGLFDHEGNMGDLCYDGICRGGAVRAFHTLFSQDHDFRAVGLVHESQAHRTYGILDLRQIPGHILGKITHTVACVEAVKRGGTFTTTARKDTVYKVWICGKHRVLEVSYPSIWPKEVRQV